MPEVTSLSVCHIASGDLWAGAEVQIATVLAELRHAGVHTQLIVLNEGRLAQEVRRHGIRVTAFPESTLSFTQILKRATQELCSQKIAILHSHRYKEDLLAALLARRCGVRTLVVTRHGMPEPFRGMSNWKHRIVDLVDRWVIRYAANAVVSVSSDMTERLRQFFGRERVCTIINGIDVNSVQSLFSPAEAKQRLGVPEGSVLIGTVGRIEPVKRIDMFLNAATLILKRFPDAWFAIVGTGSLSAEMQRLATDLGIADRVVFTGQRDDVYDVLRALDVFIMSSDHEGMPMALLEALALELPTVARAVGGMNEVITNGLNGILVHTASAEALAEACGSLLQAEPAERQRMGRLGREAVVDRFSSRNNAKQLLELYRRLVESR